MKWEERPLEEAIRHRSEFFLINDPDTYRRVTVQTGAKGIVPRDQVTGFEIKTKKQQAIKADEFLVAEIDAKVGGYGIVPKEHEGAVVSSHYFLFSLDREQIDPRWLHWGCKRPQFQDQIRARGSTNYASIRLEKVLNVRLPLPPVDEQHRIVAKLDAAAERIARIEAAQSANAEDFDRALHSHFASTLPHAKWMRMSEVAPLSWRQIEIEPEKNYTEFGVRSFFKGIFLRREVPGTAFSWQELYRLQAGDIVFSNIMAWEKAIAVARPEHEGWVGNHRMLTCEPNRDFVTPSYLHHYFTTPEGFDKILRASPGTAARNKTLKADDLMAIEVPVPPLPQQHAFDALCEKFARLRAAQQSRSTDLAALMPSLLDRAFKGEL